ncbi:MAG: MbnP family protein, partial [Polyangiales bacterium]
MKKVTVLLLGLALLGFGCDSSSTDGTGGSGGTGTQDVTINFAAMVGDAEFVCGDTYEGLGSDNSSLTLSDFRFYVQDVELKDANDDWVPVTLATSAENKFQLDQVVLLDFEDRCAGNEAGNPELNDMVVGTVPEGEYNGLRFAMGV